MPRPPTPSIPANPLLDGDVFWLDCELLWVDEGVLEGDWWKYEIMLNPKHMNVKPPWDAFNLPFPIVTTDMTVTFFVATWLQNIPF